MSNIKRLTKYPIGSYRELFQIAWPLLLSYLSANLMIFADRVILAQYSLDAMNAGSIAGTIAFVIQYFLINIAMLSEVFVGKLNGAKRYKESTTPTWQMIWISLFSIIPFFIIALNAGKFLIPEGLYELGEPYFRILLYFGFLFVFNSSIAAFFVAIGNTRIVAISIILGNLVNITADIILVFGIEGYVPEMGIRGAAIGSNCGMFVGSLVYIGCFFAKENRLKFSSHIPRFCLKTMKQCFALGLPTSIGFTLELSAWGFALYFLPSISKLHITVFAVGHTIFLVFTALSDSIKRALVAVLSNCIGSGVNSYNWKVIKTSLKAYIIITFFIFIIPIYYSDLVIDLFLNDNVSDTVNTELFKNSSIIVGLIMIFISLEGLSWVVGGYLIAKEKSIFIMLVTAFNAWLTTVLPVYLAFKYYNFSYLWVWGFFIIYPTISAIIFWIKTRRLLLSE